MTQRPLPWILSLVALAVVALWLWCRPQPQWSSESPQAIAELESGLEAARRYYPREAADHFRRALEIDPGFAMPKLFLVHETRYRDEEGWDRLVEELRKVDASALNDREAFLLRYGLAEIDKDREKAEVLLTDYLSAHPKDPFGIDIRCDRLWREARGEKPAACYRHLLEIEPNWVQAQNRLGYVAMAGGRFDEAEEHFRTYRFIAPDQANPHDSLGELLILRGRYDEARQELEEAIRIRPDFCNSYGNLVDLSGYQKRFEGLEGILEQAGRNCDESLVKNLACRAELGSLLASARWEELGGTISSRCLLRAPELLWMVHRATVFLGDYSLARRLEKTVGELGEKASPLPIALHLKGVRLCAEGRLEGAAESFAGADRQLSYDNQGEGMLKLYNRLHWAWALHLEGKEKEAEHWVEEVEAVNPTLAAEYRRGEMVLPTPSGEG